MISAEVQRVLSMPSGDYPQLDMTPWEKKPGLPLEAVQRRALSAIRHACGGFFPIGVGHGKTFIALLAGTVLDRDAVVFAPPHTLPQMRRELDRLGEHYRIERAVQLVSYGILSSPKGRERLRQQLAEIDPARCVFVLDEAHVFKNRDSVRTKRIEQLLQRAPTAAVVALSGTMANRSILEFAHLTRWCLRGLAFVPADRALASWCRVVDVVGMDGWEPLTRADLEQVYPLCHWACVPWPSDSRQEAVKGAAREAFRRRMESAPGVVCEGSSDVGASLVVHELTFDPPDAILEALRDVREGIDPGGSEIVEPAHAWLLSHTLSSGFWYELLWGEWATPHFFAARKAWWGWVNREAHRVQAESARLIVEAAKTQHEAGLNTEYAQRYARWEPWANHPKPDRRAHWLTTDVIRGALATAWTAGEPTIYWYVWREVGDKLAELGDLPLYGRGDSPLNEAHRCAMSVRAQGEGLTLNDWRRCLVVDVPPTGRRWEQLLGRVHRFGTQHDEVHYGVLQHTTPVRQTFRKARKDARFAEQTKGHPQRLAYATTIAGSL